MNSDINSNHGVYYNRKDYASLIQRTAAVCIDTIFLFLLVMLIAWIWAFFIEPPDLKMAYNYGWLSLVFFNPKFFWVCTAVAYIYLAIIKPTSVRTIGYRLAKIKVVDLKGERPSIVSMTWRFILLIFGPIHIFIDLFWVGGDDYRQTLRDKFAGTIVIKPNAQPIGEGNIIYTNYNLLGFSVVFREVKKVSKTR